MKRNKILISWSTGKDSAYALHKIQKIGNQDVVGIFSTITEEYDRVAMHATRHELLKKQAKQVGLPLHLITIPSLCTNEVYEERMKIFLDHAACLGVTHIIFGDLFLEEVRRHREVMLSAMNIKPLFPLWGNDTKNLAKEMIDVGMKAIVTCIDPRKLDRSFAGRQFDEQFLRDLPSEVDRCGEYGEFHTFVYDGPMFCSSIPISVGEVVERNGFIFADVCERM